MKPIQVHWRCNYFNPKKCLGQWEAFLDERHATITVCLERRLDFPVVNSHLSKITEDGLVLKEIVRESNTFSNLDHAMPFIVKQRDRFTRLMRRALMTKFRNG